MLTTYGHSHYTSTSHIDGFYTNIPNTANLLCSTITNLNQNSDHYPVQLQLNPNSIVIKDHTTPTNSPRITYPIPSKSLQTLQTTFLEKQNLALTNLTNTLQQEHLTPAQWENAQTTLQEIINSLSQCIEHTCMTKPIPPLPSKVKTQGGFLPRIQQKKWKRLLKIHHTIRNAIRATCQYSLAHLPNKPNIISLQSLQTPSIPPLPTNPTDIHTWVEELAIIGKNAKVDAHKILTKQTSINCKKTITKYRALLNSKPKTIHKKIFNPTTNNILDCLENSHGQTLIYPQDIAQEIYQTQQKSFQRQTPLCDDTTDHPDACTCAVRKYP